MSTTLSDIRFMLERELQVSLENETNIIWCNNAQSDFGASINVPATATISVLTTQLTYALPTNLKIITRLWSQTDYDNGIDAPIQDKYRIFNGNIIFPAYFTSAFTLNVDYYKLLTHFTTVSDLIDIDDRYATIYTYYGKAMYYQLPSVVESLGAPTALNEYNAAMQGYKMVKDQVIQQYLFRNEPSVVNERW